jgi:hypothetical protein
MKNLQPGTVGEGGKEHSGVFEHVFSGHLAFDPRDDIRVETRDGATLLGSDHRESLLCVSLRYDIRTHIVILT